MKIFLLPRQIIVPGVRGDARSGLVRRRHHCGFVRGYATVRVGYPQPSGAMLPLWLVSDAKLDQKYGLPVQNIFISGAARMNQSMVAGDIDLASIGGAVVNTVLAGGDLVAIAVGVPDLWVFSLWAPRGQGYRQPARQSRRAS